MLAQPVDGDLQMDVALAPQHHLLQVGILLEHEGRVLLDELGDAGVSLTSSARFLGAQRRGHRPASAAAADGSSGAAPVDSTVPVAIAFHARQAPPPRRARPPASFSLLRAR